MSSATTKPALWHHQAACREADPEIFFSGHKADQETALAYCTRCPVCSECREAREDAPGVWGGEVR